jgi:hypothetical protein
MTGQQESSFKIANPLLTDTCTRTQPLIARSLTADSPGSFSPIWVKVGHIIALAEAILYVASRTVLLYMAKEVILSVKTTAVYLVQLIHLHLVTHFPISY